MKANRVRDLEQARALIEAFSGKTEDFSLEVSDQLQDALGMNMAIITDYILKKGWAPDGFEQEDGFRRYWYKRPA